MDYIDNLVQKVIILLKNNGINITNYKKLNVPSGQGKTIVSISIKDEKEYILKIVDVTPEIMQEEPIEEITAEIKNQIMFMSIRTFNEIEMSKKCPNLPQLRTIADHLFEYIIYENSAYLFYIEEKIPGTMFKYKENYTLVEVISFLEQLIDNIKIMSENNYVHRDITPSNIMENKGKYFLIDGGIGKNIENGLDITKTGLPIGKTRYLAPEQERVVANMKWTFQTDLYPLGIIATEMFVPNTRHIPDTDIRDIQIVAKKWLEKDNSYEAQLLFKKIIANLLNEIRALRFNSITELLEELEKVKKEVIK